jgi:hypothetical protein
VRASPDQREGRGPISGSESPGGAKVLTGKPVDLLSGNFFNAIKHLGKYACKVVEMTLFLYVDDYPVIAALTHIVPAELRRDRSATGGTF